MSNALLSHRSVSLFTCAGGLDLGLEAAGFRTAVCVEMEEDARKTLARNRPSWAMSDPGNIHALRPVELLKQGSLRPRETALLVGGPPCQPFSKSSYWTNGDARRLADPRSLTLQAFIEAVKAVLPRVLLLENVQGLAYRGKDEGLRLLVSGLERINRAFRTSYRPQLIQLNAANYGVPQVRHRVFVIASIDGSELVMPPATHGCRDDQVPWLTTWDAIGDLNSAEWSSSLDLSGRWANLLRFQKEKTICGIRLGTRNVAANRYSGGERSTGPSCSNLPRTDRPGRYRRRPDQQRVLFIGRIDCFQSKSCADFKRSLETTKSVGPDGLRSGKSGMRCRRRLASY